MASNCTNNALEGFIPFNGVETPEKMKEIARKELGETEEVKEKSLQQIKSLIEEHNLACITRDDFLLRFLRVKKFNVQRGFEALQNYARYRVSFHKRLMKMPPEVVVNCLRHNVIGILPYRDAEERLLFFFTTDGWNPRICSDEEIMMIIILISNYMAEKESSQITGVHAIFDNTHIPLAHAPYLLRHIFYGKSFLFHSLPVRYKGFHSINEGFVIKYVLRLMDPFLPKKIKSRIVLHSTAREDFFQIFPRSVIPTDYGGTFGPLNTDHLIDVMIDYFQKMKEEQRYFIENL